MARGDSTKTRLAETIAMGESNKKYISLAKNWCKHINIEDRSGGIVAEMYSLPINQNLSCPHTTYATGGMNFEWIAYEFIKNNCIDCTFHTEISEHNYGRMVIKKINQQAENQGKIEIEKQKHFDKLKFQIDTLLVTQNKLSVTAVSVIDLARQLDNPDTIEDVSNKLLEASKLSADYFEPVAIDYMSLYLNSEGGENLVSAIQELQKSGRKVSAFVRERICERIDDGRFSENVVALYDSLSNTTELRKEAERLTLIIENLNYDHFHDLSEEEELHFSSVVFFQRINKEVPEMYESVFTQFLKRPEKHNRISVINFLRELYAKDNAVVIPFLPFIIKSLEFEEDEYGDSADSYTKSLLHEIYLEQSSIVLNTIEALFDSLSIGAKLVILSFYGKIVSKISKEAPFTDDANVIKNRLIKTYLGNFEGDDIFDSVPKIIERLSSENPQLLFGDFETLLGQLLSCHKNHQLLKWQIQDVSKGLKKSATFNPLVGKPDYELESLDIKSESLLKNSRSIVENLIKHYPQELHSKVLEIILGLDSNTDEILKCDLVDCLRNSLKDRMVIGNLLPFIYTWLHDIHSVGLRYRAMQFVRVIIDKHPLIVTQTLIDTVKIFLNDTEAAIRASAIECYTELLRNFPEHVEEIHITAIIAAMLDRYVIVHKRANEATYAIFPFLNEGNLKNLELNLISLENHYFKDKDYNYSKEILRRLLYITKKDKKKYEAIVTNVLTKYCDSREYYIVEEAVKNLMFIAREDTAFQALFAKHALIFIQHTTPDRFNSGSHDRSDFFDELFKLSDEALNENFKILTDLLVSRIENLNFSDIYKGFALLAHFRKYDILRQMTDYFSQKVASNAAFQNAIGFNSISGRISKLEQKCSEKDMTASDLYI